MFATMTPTKLKISIYIDADIKEKLDRLCEQSGRSLSNYCSLIIKESVSQHYGLKDEPNTSDTNQSR